jgi:hypothetical protein
MIACRKDNIAFGRKIILVVGQARYFLFLRVGLHLVFWASAGEALFLRKPTFDRVGCIDCTFLHQRTPTY